ncbi:MULTISPECIES: DUF4352 domain-containing protein [Dehalobacter]|uniref:DUF4352 domain-containing protein n=1 Tax=Dehalobacter restrictus (strain DSM 9455 / PER-K23) TaxID=871738 RepID=A0ABN4C0J3_DEHRP|nr:MULTISPECIES: DUF4352 domain-containing protein [Dehalobacter]AHF11396.1 hypothetical protein DEHRE_09950 [Dehalobacter restrictus DSM 9455]MDJ0304932.1 DUF4352 domain-containing protein [Dehalobacter sp.]
MKKLTGLLLIIGMFFIAGCANIPSPESTVTSFIEAGKKFDLPQMASIVDPTDSNSKTKILDLMRDGEDGKSQSQKYFLDYFQENAAKITYTVKEPKIENDQATLTVDIKYMNGEPLLKAVLQDVFTEAFTSAITGSEIKDEEIEQMLMSAMQKHKATIQESYVEKSINVQLIKVNRHWYISQPSDELLDVFLSNFILVTKELNKNINSSSDGAGQGTNSFMEQAKKENLTIIPKAVGDEIILTSIKLRVNHVEEKQTISSKYSYDRAAKDGAKFVIINADVTNMTNKAFTFPPDLIVVDHKNREYKTYADSTNTIDNYLDYRELSPGITENGNWVYELPADAESYKLYVKKSGTRELYEILLK